MGLFWKKKAAPAGKAILAPSLPGMPEFPQFPGKREEAQSVQHSEVSNAPSLSSSTGSKAVVYEQAFSPNERPGMQPSIAKEIASEPMKKTFEVPMMNYPSAQPRIETQTARPMVEEGFTMRPQPQFSSGFEPRQSSSQEIPTGQNFQAILQQALRQQNFQQPMYPQPQMEQRMQASYQPIMQAPPPTSFSPNQQFSNQSHVGGREELSPGEQPVFVKLDRYKEAMQQLQVMKQQMKEVETVLTRLEDIRKREENELGIYRDHLNMLKDRLLELDKKLFEV